jgi:hypothetical protein
MKLHGFLTLLICMFLGFGYAQNAEISGTITDETGATFPTVLIFLDGSTIPVRSDMDGNYKLKNIESGKHTILFRFPEYKPVEMTDIIIKSGEKKSINVKMEPAAQEIGEFTVKGEMDKGGTASLEKDKQNAATVSDGTSSEEMKKRPDTKASDALKRISGASIQDLSLIHI